jgi:GntR family transcriptional regulator
MPSVRAFAADAHANPLTVAKAYQTFIESGILRMRRGVGLFVVEGGRSRLRLQERARFLADEWPNLRAEIERLRLDERGLVTAALGVEEIATHERRL